MEKCYVRRNGSFIYEQILTLVPFDSNMNIVGCNWVYKIKKKYDETIDRFKARLVAKDYK